MTISHDDTCRKMALMKCASFTSSKEITAHSFELQGSNWYQKKRNEVFFEVQRDFFQFFNFHEKTYDLWKLKISMIKKKKKRNILKTKKKCERKTLLTFIEQTIPI